MSPKSLDERSSTTNVTSETNTNDDDDGGISDRSIVKAPAIDAIPISPSIFSDKSKSCSFDGVILKTSPNDDNNNDYNNDYNNDNLAHVQLPLLKNLILF